MCHSRRPRHYLGHHKKQKQIGMKESLSYTTLHTENLSIGYRNRKKHPTVIKSDINLTLYKGELVCLIGPNGCGKSTLLRTVSGLQPSLNGSVYIYDKLVNHLNLAELAKQLSIVLTDQITVRHLTVHQIVALGRYPFTNWVGKLSKKDEEIIHQSLKSVHLLKYANTNIGELSDGEKQRVMIAKALAQDTPVILLDEPTAHLDLPNRVETMQLLKNLAQKTQKSILLSTHELDLALQAADRIWLMNYDDSVICGAPEDLILGGQMEETFKANSFTFNKNTGVFEMNHQFNTQIYFEADSLVGKWTRRALFRAGYEAVSDKSCELKLDLCDNKWCLSHQKSSIVLSSIEELVLTLKNNPFQ